MVPGMLDILTFSTDADPDCLSYDFKLTDDYLKNIDDCGTRILYRLGVSIEHFSRKITYTRPGLSKVGEDLCRHSPPLHRRLGGWIYYKRMMWEI